MFLHFVSLSNLLRELIRFFVHLNLAILLDNFYVSEFYFCITLAVLYQTA